jgi:predicted Zn-dependent peptidase
MDLLDEGTRTLDKVAWEARQADHAVQLSSWAGEETSGVRVRALRSELGPALDMMRDAVQRPGLRENDLARIVRTSTTDLAQRTAEPAGIARRLFPALVFGERHPYGRLVTEQSLARIERHDCGRLLRGLGPAGARLWVVGMIGKDELKKELETRFRGWAGPAPKRRRIAPAKAREGAIVFVQVDGAVQSQVWVGHPGPERDAADYEATTIMAQILGGSFSSRINMNLREDKGYSYGGRGTFHYHREGSHFAANSSVEVSSTALSLREMLREIATMRASDPTQTELDREIHGALLSIPGLFSDPGESMRTLQGLAYHGLPLDWHEGHQVRLGEVGAQSVRKAAEEHLRASNFVVLVVGDGKAKSAGEGPTVLDDLRKIADEGVVGASGLQVVDADGRLLEAFASRPPADAPKRAAVPAKVEVQSSTETPTGVAPQRPKAKPANESTAPQRPKAGTAN